MVVHMTPATEDLARRYLRALEERTSITDFLHDEAIIEVLPNRLDPKGTRRKKAEALSDVERGRKLLSSEHYEVTSAISSGERAVLEVNWTGVLAVALGALKVGDSLRARCSMHFVMREGRVLSQTNYDCFEAF